MYSLLVVSNLLIGFSSVAHGQSLAAAEDFHGRLLLVGAREGISTAYLGGLSRKPEQGGLFSEEIGRWLLHRNLETNVYITLLSDGIESVHKVQIGEENLFSKFSYTDRLENVKRVDIEKILGMKSAKFWAAIEAEKPLWGKPAAKNK